MSRQRPLSETPDAARLGLGARRTRNRVMTERISAWPAEAARSVDQNYTDIRELSIHEPPKHTPAVRLYAFDQL
jgi:hypothetical protein